MPLTTLQLFLLVTSPNSVIPSPALFSIRKIEANFTSLFFYRPAAVRLHFHYLPPSQETCSASLKLVETGVQILYTLPFTSRPSGPGAVIG